MTRTIIAVIAWLLALVPLYSQEDEMVVRVMATSDIHSWIAPYDYYKDRPEPKFGLAQTATLIKRARSEVKNSLLFDNGDLLQGTPLANYIARNSDWRQQPHPVYQVCNLLRYDAAAIGNHEFNYGLEFLDKAIASARFPVLCTNIYVDDGDDVPENDRPYFRPYVILDRCFHDQAGHAHRLKIGVIAFTPPQVMRWDRENLQGKVKALPIIACAKKFVPQLKKLGADLVIALIHYDLAIAIPESAGRSLSQVPGIDAMVFGHTHQLFPGPDFAGIKGVDNLRGNINGIAAVMPGFWGGHLGLIDLRLKKKQNGWQVVASQSTNRAIATGKGQQQQRVDPTVMATIAQIHRRTIKYMRAPVGKTTLAIHSYFSLIRDDASVQLVNNAQRWYTQQHIQGSRYGKLPVLAAAAPLKAGGRSGPGYYTEIPAGTIAIKNISDLYVYPNSLKVVLVTGSELRQWLEMSAGLFNQITPGPKRQPLHNPAFSAFNFDIIDGLDYEIDVTQPARYDPDGNLQHPKASRIFKLRYQGQPIQAEQKFLVATNNYRAGGGGNFPGLDGSNIVYDFQEEVREIIIRYLQTQARITPRPDNNWRLAPLPFTANVSFLTAPAASPYAAKVANIRYLDQYQKFARYLIDWGKSR